MKNQLSTIVEKLERKPRWIRGRLLDYALGSTIKFVGTAGLHCEKLTQKQAIFTLKNRKKVRNHIGTIHAAATSLVAETASGLVLGMNIPDDKVPVLKTMHVDYVKRSTGALTAVAKISEQQVEQLHLQDKGEMNVLVTVTDDANAEPVKCVMTWAWTPKVRHV